MKVYNNYHLCHYVIMDFTYPQLIILPGKTLLNKGTVISGNVPMVRKLQERVKKQKLIHKTNITWKCYRKYFML